MNYSVVIYILGWIMEIEAAFLALPGIVSAIYGEKGGFAFLGGTWQCGCRFSNYFAETEEHAVLSAGRFRDGSTFVDSDVCDWMSAVCDQW